MQELRGVLAVLPDRERGASALSRAFNLDRITCQRITGTLNRLAAGPESLVHLPGVEGLRQFLDALSPSPGFAGRAELLAAAGAAVNRFEDFIRRVAGSQRQLRFRLGASPAPEPEGSGDTPAFATREALFRAAQAATGRWSESVLNIRAVRPVPGSPHLTEGLVVRGLLGHMSRPDAVPLEFGESLAMPAAPPAGAPFVSLANRQTAGTTSLLPGFCSEPLPRVTSRSAGDRIVYQIDAADRAPARPMDLVMAHLAAQPDQHPASRRPAIGEMWFLVTFPARRLVFDVFLHQDIARRCIPSVSTHLWGPDVVHWGSSRWSTRFPGGPRLTVLERGLAGVATPGSPRHTELMARVFAGVGWDPGEFTGYRCEVQYPLWRAGYCMLFDFTGNELPTAP